MEKQDTERLKEQRYLIAKLNTILIKLDNQNELLLEDLMHSKTEVESMTSEIKELN